MRTSIGKVLLRRLCLAAAVAAVAACNADTPQSLVASGKAYSAKRDHKAAAIQFKAALQIEPRSGETRLLLGRALLDGGDPVAAALELSKALDDNVSPERVLPSLSRALLLTGENKKLTTLYGTTSLSDKEAMAALKSNVATAWGALGDKAKTEAAIQAALAASPQFGPARLLKARLMAGQRQFEPALQLVDEILAADPALYEAWMLKGEIKVVANNDNKAAEAAFRQAVTLERAYLPAHAALVTLQLQRQDIAAAKAQAEQLRALLPAHPQTLFIDAMIAYREGELKKARELIQQLLRVVPDHPGVLELAGVVEAHLGGLVLAESYLSKVLSIEPGQASARRNLGHVYNAVGQPAKALEVLQPLLAERQPDAEALALAGESQLRLGNARAAESFYSRAAQLQPDNTRLQTASALTRLSRGDPQAAFSELATLAAGSKDTYADMAIVSARLKRLEYDAALAALDAMDKKLPNQAATAELRGRVLMARKDYAGARLAFEQALKLSPALFAATFYLAALDLQEGKPQQAQQRLEASIKDNPRNHYARLALADLRSRNGASTEEVKAILADAVKNSPSEAAPRLALIDLSLRKRQYKDAMTAAQEAATALPNDVAVLDAVGRAQMESGNIEQAINTFRKIAGITPNASTPYLRLAAAYVASGQRDMTESALKKALEVEPNSPIAQQSFLDYTLGHGKTQAAVTFARSMQQQHPEQPSGYALEGATHTRLKAADAAIAAYRKGVAAVKEPSDLPSQLYLALMNAGRTAEADRLAAERLQVDPNDARLEYQIGTVASTRGQLEQAELHLTRSLALNAENALAQNNLAWVLATRGKPGAVGHAQRANELAPNQPAVLDTLALALASDKQFAPALEQQRRAVELAPADNNLRFNLAKIALQAGDKGLARTELERLKSLGASFKFQDDVAKLMKSL